MCIALPGRIVEVDADGQRAQVDVLGRVQTVHLTLLGTAAPGEWVLVHTGFAVERLTAAEAAETVRLLEELAPALDQPAADRRERDA